MFPPLAAVGHPGVRSPPPVRERPRETVFWLLCLVCSGKPGPAAQRFLQDALCGRSDGAAHLCMMAGMDHMTVTADICDGKQRDAHL